jgi:thiopurine S-methyltransferase
MPWDAGATPAALERHLAEDVGSGRVLIPGCGTAYEARTFSHGGYEVTAIDFSPAAIEMANAQVEDAPVEVILGDFFSHDFGARPFDVIYERAFLASLPRRLWSAYAVRVSELLRRGGKLLGFFVYGEERGGPPFCLKQRELESLLGESFERTADTRVEESVPVFLDRERWEVWERK